MPYPSPRGEGLAGEEARSRCGRALARGPLIVSRTSARRIDLSHGERQIAVRRSFASLEASGPRLGNERERKRERGKERGEKEEVRKGKRGKGIPAREQIRETRSNLLIYLFSSSRFAREASRKWNERR